MSLFLFRHRVRGFRTINIVLGASLLVLAVSVNLAKVIAGHQRSEISQVERDIGKQRARIRLLEAEVAHLEQPERLERLSRAYLDLKPVTATQEASIDSLDQIASAARPTAHPVSTGSLPVP
ncbi:MAG: cell division protein [Caulobacter sp.]|nr:cell division protein [Caulobacter sp.]